MLCHAFYQSPATGISLLRQAGDSSRARGTRGRRCCPRHVRRWESPEALLALAPAKPPPATSAWRKCSALSGFTCWHMMAQLKQKWSRLGNPDYEVTVSTATAITATARVVVAQKPFFTGQGYLHHRLQKSKGFFLHHWRPEEESHPKAQLKGQYDQLLPLKIELSLWQYILSALNKEYLPVGKMRLITCSLLPLGQAVLKACNVCQVWVESVGSQQGHMAWVAQTQHATKALWAEESTSLWEEVRTGTRRQSRQQKKISLERKKREGGMGEKVRD